MTHTTRVCLDLIARVGRSSRGQTFGLKASVLYTSMDILVCTCISESCAEDNMCLQANASNQNILKDRRRCYSRLILCTRRHFQYCTCMLHTYKNRWWRRWKHLFLYVGGRWYSMWSLLLTYRALSPTKIQNSPVHGREPPKIVLAIIQAPTLRVHVPK